MRILVPGGAVQIDASDYGTVSLLTLYVGINGYVYYSTWSSGKSYPRTLHSLLMGDHAGLHIDHINGDKLDNRRANLRVVSPQLNQANRKRLNKNNTTSVRGVVRRGERWVAQITVNHHNIYLGIFADIKTAKVARRAAELFYYGEVCP